MSKEKDTLGEVIKNARSALGMTQEQLAERLGVSNRYINILKTHTKNRATNCFTESFESFPFNRI